MLYRQRSTFFYETRIKPAEKTISPFRKRTSEPGRTQKTKYAAVSRIPSEVAVGRRVQGSVKRNVFVKPNEQSRACASYAMARKRLLKTNRFAKPSAEPNKVRTMPRREMDERNSRLFPQSVLRLPTADPSGSPAYRFFHSPIDKTHLHTNSQRQLYTFILRRISEPLHPTDSRNLRRRAVFADWPRPGGSFEQAPLR